MSNRRISLWGSLILWFALTIPEAKGGAACEMYDLRFPVPGSKISELQPELQWAGENNANYRVLVSKVLPEGRILESVDTMVTGTSWRLRNPVSALTTVVKVLVSRNCPHVSIQDVNAKPPTFIVQVADQCAIKPHSLEQDDKVLRWTSTGGAGINVVQIFSVGQTDTGEVLTRRLAGYQVADEKWEIPQEFNEEMKRNVSPQKIWIASVQTRCGSLLSQSQALLLRTWQ